MTNEFDEDDDVLTEDSGNFDESNGGGNTLGDLWRNNPMVKVGIILAAGAAIFGAILLFGGDKQKPDVSRVQGAQEVNAPPATEEVSPTYADAVQEFNESEVERAKAEGGSALPVPISTPLERLEEPATPTEEDPLQRWRALQQERLAQESAAPSPAQAPTPPDTSAHDNAVQALADIMSQQMQAILESQSQSTINYRPMTGPDWLEQQRAEEEAAAQAAAAAATPAQEVEILVPAGEIAYAQLITEANSDAPGPVLAQIASGPLAGSRIIGDFQVQKELLTLNFNTVVVKGESIPINGVALDPNTTLPAMATDVDHHYLERIVLPMAAAFVEGAAEAVSESGLTTVTIQGETVAESKGDASNDQEIASGIDEAGQELGDILDDMADDLETTVRIESGTPMGVLFLEPVTRPLPGAQAAAK